MKKFFTATVMSFSMFCAIPCPFRVWDDSLRPLMTLFLPAVGAFIGLIWVLLASALRIFNFPKFIAAAILCAYPFFITGGIHLDGFLDVTDAVKSHRDLETKRKILKDPHNGSFALASCVMLFMFQFAFFASAEETADIHTLFFIPVVSRIFSALCVTALRPMSTSQYFGTYRQNVKKRYTIFLLALLFIVVAAAFMMTAHCGLVSLAVAAGYSWSMRKAFCQLDGMSGDVAGYALTLGELCGIAAYTLI